MQTLKYTPTERINISRPVNRIQFISKSCNKKRVLDLGCYDETAQIKKNEETYLFSAISSVASNHTGIDNSNLLPDDGIIFSSNCRIIKGDITDLETIEINKEEVDIIIAGELIEHLPNTLEFFKKTKEQFPNKRIICSTPNSTSLSNILLAFIQAESCHIDHLQVYSYKTLNTLCKNASFNKWEIIPYNVKYTEMILRSKGIKRLFVKSCEKMINCIEYFFPLMAGGYILEIEI